MSNLNIDLSKTRKKRITVDGDESRVLELNTSDLSIIARLESVYSELISLGDEINGFASDLPEEDVGLESIKETADKFISVDNKMRELLDKLFDANVSEVCCPDGSMYDMFDGEPRWEIILSALLDLYSDTIKAESEKKRKVIKEHTAKYTANRATRRAMNKSKK